MEVEDSYPRGLLLHELPHHVGEQVGRRIDPEMFLPAPLLTEYVLTNCLDFSRLAEIARADPVEMSCKGIQSEVLSLQDGSHGGEVQLELL